MLRPHWKISYLAELIRDKKESSDQFLVAFIFADPFHFFLGSVPNFAVLTATMVCSLIKNSASSFFNQFHKMKQFFFCKVELFWTFFFEASFQFNVTVTKATC